MQDYECIQQLLEEKGHTEVQVFYGGSDFIDACDGSRKSGYFFRSQQMPLAEYIGENAESAINLIKESAWLNVNEMGLTI